MIIIYGGSFNPPTIAHRKIAQFVLKEVPESKLIFMPVGNDYKKPELIDGKHRVNMLTLLSSRINGTTVSDYEVKLNEFLGTYNTLNYIQGLYQGEIIGFLIGADNLIHFSKWINSEKLIRNYKIIVLGRDDLDCKEIIKSDSFLHKHQDSFIILDNFRKIEVSSYEFRHEGRNDFVPQDILKYIKEHKLYNR